MDASRAVDFQKIFEHTDAVSVQGYNEKREVIYWNNASERLYGYSAAEALGQQLEDLIIPPEMRADVIALHASWLEHGEAIPSGHLTLQRADHSAVDVYSSHVMLENDRGRKEMYCVDVDLSTLEVLKALTQQQEGVLHSVFQVIPDLFFLLDKDCRILEYRANRSEDLYVSPDFFLGKLMQDVVPASVGQQFVQSAALITDKNRITTFEYNMEVDAGSRIFEARLCQMPDSDKMIAIVRDITEQKANMDALANSISIYQQMFESNKAIKLIIDPADGAIVQANTAALEFYGYSKEEMLSLKITDINTLEPADVMNEMELAKLEKRLYFDFTHRLSSGGTRDVEVYSGPVNHGDRKLLYSIIHDVSQRKEAERKIAHQAHYDTLTDLPNRFLSLDRLSQLLLESNRQSEKLAVIFLDLDDFKKINDTLGHEVGDHLLIEASYRLSDSVRSDDTVGRLGGDEFIIILRGLTENTDAIPTIDKLLEQFRRPFCVDGRELLITASMGVALYPGDGADSSALLRNSDTAMYKAKESGRNTYSFYTDSMNQAVSLRLSVEEHMHGALERGEFSVHYQPQIDVSSGQVIGAEALLRWHSPYLGHVSPTEFIPVAEQTGMIISIGNFVIESALSVLKRCQGGRFPSFRMAVNLSPCQFRDPSLVSFITRALDNARLNPADLELEITEGVLMIGHNYVNQSLRALSEAGVVLSMDDFGTGYSSLSYLRQYPFDVLKIDRSFVEGLDRESADRELVTATIAMAHGLGLKVVAEGVETTQQLDMLKLLHCDLAQGYLLGRPVSEDVFLKMSEEETALSQWSD